MGFYVSLDKPLQGTGEMAGFKYEPCAAATTSVGWGLKGKQK